MKPKTTAQYVADIEAAIDGIESIADQCRSTAQQQDICLTDHHSVVHTLQENLEAMAAIHSRLTRCIKYQAAIVKAMVRHDQKLDDMH